MSQAKGFCGHFKALWDNLPSCANCSCCSRQNTCEIYCSWPLSTWLKFEQRRSHKARMGKKNTKEKEQFAFSARPVKPKKKSAPADMFGVDDLSDHTINPGGISSSDDIVPRHTDQPDRPKAKGRGSQCGTPPSGSGFSDWKFDPILHQTDSPVNDLWMNLPVVNLWTSLPVNYVRPDRADRNSSLRTGWPVHYLPEGTGRYKSHRPNPRNRIGPDRTELGVNLQTSPPVAGPDRTGPDRTGCQSPEESTGHGTVELFTGQRTLD